MNNAVIVEAEFRRVGITEIVLARISDIKNQLSSHILEERCKVANWSLSQLTEDALRSNLILNGYRSLVTSFQRSAKRFPPSAENLIQLSKRRGGLPRISPLVDSYNVIALESMLSIGAHDADTICYPICFRLAKQREEFRAVGCTENKYTQEGDYVYADQKQILAWMDSKDAECAKISENTRNVLLIVQGNHATSVEYRTEALHKACELITTCCGGKFEIIVVETGVT